MPGFFARVGTYLADGAKYLPKPAMNFVPSTISAGIGRLGRSRGWSRAAQNTMRYGARVGMAGVGMASMGLGAYGMYRGVMNSGQGNMGRGMAYSSWGAGLGMLGGTMAYGGFRGLSRHMRGSALMDRMRRR